MTTGTSNSMRSTTTRPRKTWTSQIEETVADVTADVEGQLEGYLPVGSLDDYSTTAENDDVYAQIDDLPFLAGGTVEDVDPGDPGVTQFNGPVGASATVTQSDPGEYTVTVDDTGGLTNPVVQVTGIADPEPGALTSSGATACALSDARPPTVGNTFVFSVGCFGEDDANPGAIVPEDISFVFLIIG